MTELCHRGLQALACKNEYVTQGEGTRNNMKGRFHL